MIILYKSFIGRKTAIICIKNNDEYKKNLSPEEIYSRYKKGK